jgi:fructokinase
LKLLAVTRGSAGAMLFSRDHCVAVPGIPVPVVDTVGCGDAFMAALLAGILEHGTESLTERLLGALGRFACAAGAFMAGVSGAMAAMPGRSDIDALQRAAGAHHIAGGGLEA